MRIWKKPVSVETLTAMHIGTATFGAILLYALLSRGRPATTPLPGA